MSLEATGNNPYLDTVSRIGMISYKNHVEMDRTSFTVSGMEGTNTGQGSYSLSEACDSIVNKATGTILVVYGQTLFLQTMLHACRKEAKLDIVDCEDSLYRTVPALRGYARGRLEELFRIHVAGDDAVLKDCVIVQKLFRLCQMFSKGKQIDVFVPDVERYFSGYWEKRIVIDPYAKLAEFDKKEIVIAGEFKAMSRDDISGVVLNSCGKIVSYPDKTTEVAIVGNTEFPAPFQTRALHEALLRIRQNQDIRIISELELLSLLYGQYAWKKEINPYYLPVAGKMMVFPVQLVFSGETAKHVPIGFPFGKKKDSDNSRGLSKKSKITDKLIDAIKSSL